MFKFTKKKKSGEVSLPAAPEPTAEPATEPAPEIIQEIEAQFPEEDSAAKREHFERVIDAPPSKVFAVFVSYIWNQNAGVSQVEVVKGPSVPDQLESGMIRRVAGYEEEVISVKKDKLIEFKFLDGLPTSYNKSRILFKPEENDTKTRVVWTIWWSPTSVMTGFLYTMMMKGYCNLALYRLEQAVTTGVREEPKDIENEADAPDAKESSMFDESAGTPLAAGEKHKIQWAARIMTGYEGNLTPDQAASLNELREALKKEDPEAWELCQKHPDGADRFMLRFLRAECHGRARKFEVERSKKRLGETLRFRRDMKCDEMIYKDPPMFKEFIQAGGELTGILDKEGRPVVISRVGLLSTCLDTKIMNEEDWKRNVACTTERRMQDARESGKKLGYEISASVLVYDVRGIGLSSRKILPFTKFVSEIASKHYPEMVDVIVVTHAPAVFSGLFAAIKGFLDPVTASKVRVFGSSKQDVAKMKKALRQIIDPEILPREYGGDSSVEVGYPANYKGEKYAYD